MNPDPTTLSTYVFVAASVPAEGVPFSVIMLVAKFPEPSRTTREPAMSVAETVASLAFVMVPLVMSPFTIDEVDNFPVPSVCTTPAEANALTVTFPDESIKTASDPLVLRDKVLGVAEDRPVVTLPVKLRDGIEAVPAGRAKFPVMVSPAFNTFPLASPVKEAVMVPAEKFPDPSRATMVLTVLLEVAVVAELATFPAVEITANFVSTMAALFETSAFTIDEVLRLPELSV